MDVLEIIKTIQKDWPILVVFFALGGAWWQGKQWFKKINDVLDREGKEHASQNVVLSSIHEKVEYLEERSNKIETTVNEIQDHIQSQEVKLAVLEAKAVVARR